MKLLEPLCIDLQLGQQEVIDPLNKGAASYPSCPDDSPVDVHNHRPHGLDDPTCPLPWLYANNGQRSLPRNDVEFMSAVKTVITSMSTSDGRLGGQRGESKGLLLKKRGVISDPHKPIITPSALCVRDYKVANPV